MLRVEEASTKTIESLVALLSFRGEIPPHKERKDQPCLISSN